MPFLRRRRVTGHELSCADVVELLTDYVEGALQRAVADRVTVHLSRCEDCTVYLDQMSRTVAAMRDTELSGLPEGACAELVDAFRHWLR